jgi:hypothetical protein
VIILLRIVIGLLIVAVLGIALVPLVVLLDLRDGGTGWGLCPDGVGGCRNSYFAGFELLAAFLVVLFAVLALIRLFVRMLRAVERHKVELQRQGRVPTG